MVVYSIDYVVERGPRCHVDIEAQDSEDAKEKILKFVQKRVKRLGSMRGRCFSLVACPHLPTGQIDTARKLEIVWPYRNKRILDVRNPNLIFG